MEAKKNYRFDFTFFINDKIICQRFFEDYDYKKNHIDFNVAVDIITVSTNLIKDFLKKESIEVLWKNYDYFNSYKTFYKEPKNDLFKLTVSFNSKIIASSCIEGYVYPPKGKYNLDIRPIVPMIISSIRFGLKY
ncbi:MAG: hypothetical protein ABI576_20775 [Flavobacterium sp.]